MVCIPGQPNTLQTTMGNPSASTINVVGICTGHFSIHKSLTLQGPAILDGGNSGTVVTVKPGVIATLDSLVVRHGNNSLGNGGGIVNGGIATLNASRVSDNSAGARGGGIYNTGNSVLSLNSSQVSNNTAVNGGGIYNVGSLVNLKSSQVSNNTATGPLGPLNGLGGGIFNLTGDVNLNASSVSNNTADNSGGGIFSQLGDVQLVASIVLGNVATSGSGGGIFNVPGGTVGLRASFVILNRPNNCTPSIGFCT